MADDNRYESLLKQDSTIQKTNNKNSLLVTPESPSGQKKFKPELASVQYQDSDESFNDAQSSFDEENQDEHLKQSPNQSNSNNGTNITTTKHPACQFQADKPWLDCQFHDWECISIKKPDEIENEMEDPPDNYDKKILNRIHGSMIGMTLGDALGAHVEFRPRDYLRDNPVEDLQGGGTWGLRKGQFTDDTSMALCLANSLIARRDFNCYDQLVRYRWWHIKGYMSSTGKCFDIGSATRRSLDEFARRQNAFAEKNNIPIKDLDFLSNVDLLQEFDVRCSQEGVAGNGALMRLAPVPLFFYQNPVEAVEFSGISGQITHGDQKAYDACRYYGALIVAALHGETKEQLLDKDFYLNHLFWFDGKTLHSDIMRVAQGSYQKEGGYDEGIRGKGYIVDALEAALWAFWSDGNSFKKGVLAAVNLGDDTDTTAAIYGQLAGAYYGYQNLPDEWVEQVYAKKFIETLSKWITYEGQHRQTKKISSTTITVNLKHQNDYTKIPTTFADVKPQNNYTPTPTSPVSVKPRDDYSTTPTSPVNVKSRDNYTATPTSPVNVKPRDHYTTTTTSSVNVTPQDNYTTIPTSPVNVKPKDIFTTTPTSPVNVKPRDIYTTTPTSPVNVKPQNLQDTTPTSPLNAKSRDTYTTIPTSPVNVKPRDNYATTPTSPVNVKPRDNYTTTPTSPVNVTSRDTYTATPTSPVNVKPRDNYTTITTSSVNVTSRDNYTTIPTSPVSLKPRENYTGTPTSPVNVKPKDIFTTTPTSPVSLKPRENYTGTPTSPVNVKPKDIFTTTPTSPFNVKPRDSYTTTPTSPANVASRDNYTTIPTSPVNAKSRDNYTTIPTSPVNMKSRDNYTTIPTSPANVKPRDDYSTTPTSPVNVKSRDNHTTTTTSSINVTSRDNYSTTPTSPLNVTSRDNYSTTPTSPLNVTSRDNYTTIPTSPAHVKPQDSYTTIPTSPVNVKPRDNYNTIVTTPQSPNYLNPYTTHKRNEVSEFSSTHSYRTLEKEPSHEFESYKSNPIHYSISTNKQSSPIPKATELRDDTRTRNIRESTVVSTHVSRESTSNWLSTNKSPKLSTNLMLWTINDVGRWIQSLGENYSIYVDSFKKDHVDGFRLYNFINNKVLIEYGVKNEDHQKKIINGVEQLKNDFRGTWRK